MIIKIANFCDLPEDIKQKLRRLTLKQGSSMRYWSKTYDNISVAYAMLEDKIIGWTALFGRDHKFASRLLAVYISRAYRAKGVASKLVEELLGKSKNIERVSYIRVQEHIHRWVEPIGNKNGYNVGCFK